MRSLFVALVLLTLYVATEALHCDVFGEEGDEFDKVWADIEEDPYAISEWEFLDEFEKREANGKGKKSKDERKKLLKSKIKEVNKVNKQAEPEWCAKASYVLTLDDEEIKKGLKGLDKKKPAKLNNIKTKRSPEKRQMALRSKRDTGSADQSAATGPVEQQKCGNCWAYAASHALVGTLKLKASKTIDGSEVQLTNCVYDPNGGCGGGHSFEAYDYLKKNTFLAEDQYQTALDPKACDKSKLSNPQPVVTGWKFVDGQGYSTGIADTAGTDAARQAMRAVLNEQPLVVYMNTEVGGFGSFGKGVWSTDLECKSLDHAMTAVGYGKDDKGVEYWLIKNSWGTSWGDKGFIKVKAGKNVCNIEAYGNYPVVKAGGGGGEGGEGGGGGEGGEGGEYEYYE